MQNTDITHLMMTIVGNLMPVCSKEANPDLWLIYDQLQKWALLTQHRVPAQATETAKTADAIIVRLGKLRDRKLAHKIARVIRHHTPDMPDIRKSVFH